MAKPRFGRDARMYYHTSSFAASGLTEITRCQDISVTDEAQEQVATARDYAYDVKNQGSKNFEVTFTKVVEATDQTTMTALLNAYKNKTDLYFVICNADKAIASGDALTFVGQVLTRSKEAPQNGEMVISFKLVNSDPDNPPTDVTTPLA
jgi:hypothetical protein